MQNKRNSQLFTSGKFCQICGRLLSKSYQDTLCPACLEQKLFSKVRDYIRSNDVTEHDVARHFGLSLHQVKKWIRDGRIEYKAAEEDSGRELYGVHCLNCGKAITTGSFCASCMRQINIKSGVLITKKADDSQTKFHYLDNNDK